MSEIGNFNDLASEYHKSRQGFGARVFESLEARVGGLKGKVVLDIGCGTGIASRQLAERGAQVVGSDVSEKMIKAAESVGDRIEYVVTPAHKLPFPDEKFDLVTAFSAFHWFADTKSIDEIKRVLQSGGTFAVINKHDVGGIRKDVVDIFKKYTDQVTGKKNYNPEKILRDNGFEGIESKTFSGSEQYTFESAFTYLKSIALWNAVPENKKNIVEDEIKTYLENLNEQALKRELETVVVFGNVS